MSYLFFRIEGNNVMAVQDEREEQVEPGTALTNLLPSFAFDICSDSVCSNVQVLVF